MKRLYQEKLDPNYGDCFKTCIAMITEIDRDRMPNFCDWDGDWWGRTQKWLQRRRWGSLLFTRGECKCDFQQVSDDPQMDLKSLRDCGVPLIVSAPIRFKGYQREHSVVLVGNRQFDPLRKGAGIDLDDWSDVVLLIKGVHAS